MYEPAHFRVEEKAELIDFVRRCPLGLLIAQGAGGLSADLVPFLIDDAGAMLRAHVAKANPLAHSLETPQKTLVVFSGANAYVSPSLYPSKAAHGKVVPTWNYAMVQVSGAARLRAEPDWIEAQVGALTAQQEAGRASPWAVGDAPRAYVEAQLRGVVGVEIAIEDLRGKYKLSQNRSEQDRQGVAQGLARDARPGDAAVAQMMRR